jgi:methylenetetrahydrofolate reductase (NADPH)
VQLIKMARGLRDGFDIAGNAIENPPDMALGAVVNPNCEPLALQLMKMKKKIDAGAEFFQTQAVYDMAVFQRFMEKARLFDRPIQVGVVVLKSPEMGRYMNAHVSGIQVPQVWLDEIAGVAKEDRKKKAAEMMGRFLRQIKPLVQGVHIMPLGWSDVVPDILAHADIEVEKAA